MFQFPPQPARFQSHDGIRSRVEILGPAQDRNANRLPFQAVSAPGQCFIDDVFEERASAVIRTKLRTLKHTVELFVYGRLFQRRR
ncbi:hypothetical protein [Ruegeria arenilitoris]|uniref:hypothetical protein n=1 Tax=Ruegeria arenilitoris TaxID=1173585 RepID=UPI001C2BEB61|nr:hypothetical protein [Ruegeria arenilitoris]